jgi:hypothetical protein
VILDALTITRVHGSVLFFLCAWPTRELGPEWSNRPQAAPHSRNACQHARRCDHPELARSLHAPWRNGGSQQAHIRCSHWVRSGVHDQPIGACPWHGRCAVSHGTAAVQSKADETGPQIRDPGAFRLELELRGRRGLRTRRMSRPPRPGTPPSGALALISTRGRVQIACPRQQPTCPMCQNRLRSGGIGRLRRSMTFRISDKYIAASRTSIAGSDCCKRCAPMLHTILSSGHSPGPFRPLV